MSGRSSLDFHRPPRALAFMLRGLRPSPGLKPSLPLVRATWRHRTEPSSLADFLALTGLRADHGLPILYPHVFGFRLIMAVLTHPDFPLPIWRALQIRNHLRQHRPIAVEAELDLETRVEAQRVLAKGAEIDLRTTISDGSELAWESVNTFYYRGPFGGSDVLPSRATVPDIPTDEMARWRTGPPVGRRAGRLTGDYNGIHSWNWYARLLGFRKAFHHPQFVLGQCLAHLALPTAAPIQELDAWLKGPVAYQSEVCLRGSPRSDGFAFGLYVENDERPAIIGQWRAA